MGTACCLTIPRDPVSRAAVLLCILCLLLQMIAVFDAANSSRLRWLTVTTPNTTYGVTPWTIVPAAEEGKTHALSICPVSAGNNVTYGSACDDLNAAGRGAVAMMLLSIIAVLITTGILMAFTASAAKKNAQVYGMHFLLVLVPTLLQLIATFLIGVNMFDATAKVFSGTEYTTSWSHGGGLAIAALVIYLLVSLTLLGRLILYRIQANKVRAAAGDTSEERLAIRVVNDDWTRQKQIWLERRRTVVNVLASRQLGSREARIALARNRGADHSYFFQEKFTVRPPFPIAKKEPTPVADVPEPTPKAPTPKEPTPKAVTPKEPTPKAETPKEEPVQPASPSPPPRAEYRPVFGMQVVEHQSRLKVHSSSSTLLHDGDLLETVNGVHVQRQQDLQDIFASLATKYNNLSPDDQDVARSQSIQFTIHRKAESAPLAEATEAAEVPDSEGYVKLEVPVVPEWKVVKKKKHAA